MSERLSVCCGARPWGEFYYKSDQNDIGDTGICSKCKEHSEFLTEKEAENKEKLIAYLQKEWEEQEKLEIKDEED
jgi:hypothetical protein